MEQSTHSYPIQLILAITNCVFFRVANECDGMIIGTSQCYEPSETLEDLSRWFAKTSRPVHVFGPMFPVYNSASISEKEQVAKAQGLDDFIARILESHGPKSLLYVSKDFPFESSMLFSMTVFPDLFRYDLVAY